MRVALVVALLMTGSAQAGAIRFVDDDAPPGGDGVSWATAYRHLQDAVAEATGGGVAEIRVAQGTYQPDLAEGGGVTPGSRSASFRLISGVALRGGYAGLGAPDPDARDVTVYETTLTGDLLGNDGPGFVNYADNSRHVLTGASIDATASLDGFTITAGNADTAPNNSGAGLRLGAASPAIVACTFKVNLAAGHGGGLAIDASSPSVLDCTFLLNSASQAGALDSRNGSNPIICGCTFTGNSGGFGGAMNNDAGSATIEACTFLANQGTTGAALRNVNGMATITGCTFDTNQTRSGTGRPTRSSRRACSRATRPVPKAGRSPTPAGAWSGSSIANSPATTLNSAVRS